ncbi:MAG TPA: helicase C-terminal domain-containing protein [Vicinamibacteria bacterium]|nr:helicase C-terminal domain-containing protein [Vicinamibacteria bacterium]
MALSANVTRSQSLKTVERGLDALDSDRVRELLGPGGPFAASLPGFEHREAQQEMAGAVADALRDGGELLVEAGTGTGKTLAYLVPAILSGQRVVISTGTKNLQEQLFYKDIPLVREALGVPFSACLMKGRGNYLCLARFAQFQAQPSLRFFEEATYLETFQRWSLATETGDRAEIPGVPEKLDFWKGISARSENCTGKECPDFDRCWVTRLRQRATESEILVVNHHLLFADLVVRQGPYGEVIPEYDYLVLDEAHQLEDVATSSFGLTVSSARVDELVQDAEKAWNGRNERSSARREAIAELKRLRGASQELFQSFRPRDGREERYRLRPKSMTPVQERAVDGFRRQLARVREGLEGIPEPDESTVALSRRCGEIEIDLEVIVGASDPETVSWCETRERSVALRSSPIRVAPMLRATLLDQKRAVVLTSATLAVDGSFDYVSSRMGVERDRSRLLASPFDYSTQALLYVPRNLPSPRDPGFARSAAAEIRTLLKASRGRAFLLFTSFANLHAVRQEIEPAIPFPLFVQGEASRSELLDSFRETEGAVLLATSSFWEGVDVMGEQLSLVVIDKLPFAVPSDPLVSARMDWLSSTGGNAFADYQVPMAILTLKQGLGRLIRSRSDRGVVAVLDSRLSTMAYGRRFVKSLPPYRLTHDREEVESFFAEGMQ